MTSSTQRKHNLPTTHPSYSVGLCCGTMYSVHHWLVGKRVVDFLLGLVLIELFSLGVTVKVLRAKIDRKSAISLQHGQFDPKFQVEGNDPTNHFCMDSQANEPRVGPGHPSSPLSIYLIFSLFTFPFLSLALPIFSFCSSLPFLPE